MNDADKDALIHQRVELELTILSLRKLDKELEQALREAIHLNDIATFDVKIKNIRADVQTRIAEFQRQLNELKAFGLKGSSTMKMTDSEVTELISLEIQAYQSDPTLVDEDRLNVLRRKFANDPTRFHIEDYLRWKNQRFSYGEEST